MTATTPTPTLSPAVIEALELSVRGDLLTAVDTLERLRAGSAHLVAGFVEWPEYVIDRFGDLLARLKMVGDQAADRRALVRALRRGTEGRRPMSQRSIAAKLGVGLGTVSEDLAFLRRTGQLDDEPVKVASADGRDRPARGDARPDGDPTPPAVVPLPVPAGRVYQQAAEWLRRHDGGLTLVELAAVAGWNEGKASGALSYLTASSRGLAVRLEDKRAGQRVHLLTDLGRAMLDRLAEQTTPAPGTGAEDVEVGSRFAESAAGLLIVVPAAG